MVAKPSTTTQIHPSITEAMLRGQVPSILFKPPGGNHSIKQLTHFVLSHDSDQPSEAKCSILFLQQLGVFFP